ncbi:MAG: hypothetical protein JRM72_01290 [Nitrososphaerota archaeon]|nr:hypothetical protein [Nitrososphaerota archaeon]
MNKESIYTKLEADWPNLVKYVEREFKDDIRDMDLGVFQPDTAYVLVNTTEDGEACLVGYRNEDTAKWAVLNSDGGWETRSVWFKDIRLSFIKSVEFFNDEDD